MSCMGGTSTVESVETLKLCSGRAFSGKNANEARVCWGLIPVVARQPRLLAGPTAFDGDRAAGDVVRNRVAKPSRQLADFGGF
jgi:hypothetical protein